MGMLKNFFADTEKSGTVSLHPHNTIDQKSYKIKNLLIIPSAIYDDKSPKFMLFNVESTMTLWELFDTIARHFN